MNNFCKAKIAVAKFKILLTNIKRLNRVGL